MIKVLIVDDSVVTRRLLNDVLVADVRIQVVGSAANGAIALQKLPLLEPDVVLLDVEMPDMDGIETVTRLRPQHPRLPVIMCSSLTERGADVTLRALAAGATDYVAKPSSSGQGLDAFKAELTRKVIALGEASRSRPGTIWPQRASIAAPAPVARLQAARQPQTEVTALAIGCSTGGPNALATLFEGLPRDLSVPLFITQHMPPLFTKILADRLTASTRVTVVEARDQEIVEPGKAYIAPGDYHLRVGRDGTRVVVRLDQEPPENSCRPAVDVMFRSLATVYGPGVLACVLTGMGSDGARGARAIVESGGVVLAQTAATCVVPSMPKAVIEAGLADKVVPLQSMADELLARVRKPTMFAGRFAAPHREA
ncbi:MAG TPA: chemotaxis response regulator protein-glutamate methylesterase [Polyangiaceae bacterium]|nr:chemotaxis response regulator protein-glutamate methylesterase [Polyangiaceae bacterium]